MKAQLNIALAFAAGILGGLLTHYIAPTPAFAQNQPQVTKEIRAQSFTLVDQTDHTFATFTVEHTTADGKVLFRVPVRIVLLDHAGREIWGAGGSPFRPLAQR